MQSMHSATTLIATLIFAIFSADALAKPPQPYHVEMIIFERSTESSQLEYWPDDIKLSYPADVVFIKARATTPTDTIGETASDTEVASADTFRETHQSDFLDPRILPARQESQQILAAEAAKLARRYRVIFHEAWQQTFTATEKAPSVVINGGDVFDGRSELGGSIRLSINKFIHLDTNLWLAKFSPNLGQAQHWPMPPTAPRPREEKTEEPAWEFEEFQAPTIGITEESLNRLDDKYRFDASRVLNESYALAHTEQFNFLPQTVYSLKQSRRMRSKELHYIDHPRFSIIVRIDPISFEEVISQQ